MQIQKLGKIFEIKQYIIISLGIVSFSYFVAQLFGQTIPNIIWSFFKDFSEAVILATVFLFALIWLMKARPHNLPKNYSIVIFDVFGMESQIDGVRTEFKTHDVAWSFMKQYKKSYPLYNFALVSDTPKSSKRTIFRYI
ncbi:MAG TPA: hypothetical protein VLC72_02965 [Nitrosopumilaceae archaeon]|nr:hypothetical protein [Nitrosopumilaceae archaeon]